MLKKKNNNPEANPSAGVEKEKITGLDAVVVRNEFYRDGYRSLLRLALLQAVVTLCLIGTMYYLVGKSNPENFYFATTEDGRLIPMVPLSQPNLSTSALMSWSAQAATEVMSFGFNDYRRKLQDSSRNFTKRGWESFTQALQKSRMIEMVEANQQIISAAPRGAPLLQQEGLVAGAYQWVVQIPLILTYQSGPSSQNTNLMVTIVIVRVSRLESPSGVGIEQWIATSE